MKEVELVDRAMERACYEGAVLQEESDAWQKLKAELAQQPTNSASDAIAQLADRYCMENRLSDKSETVLHNFATFVEQQHP